jgi:hypothetical protein
MTYVFKNSEHPDVVAVNKLEDNFYASPAFAGRFLYLRGDKYLYALATE